MVALDDVASKGPSLITTEQETPRTSSSTRMHYASKGPSLITTEQTSSQATLAIRSASFKGAVAHHDGAVCAHSSSFRDDAQASKGPSLITTEQAREVFGQIREDAINFKGAVAHHDGAARRTESAASSCLLHFKGAVAHHDGAAASVAHASTAT